MDRRLTPPTADVLSAMPWQRRRVLLCLALALAVALGLLQAPAARAGTSAAAERGSSFATFADASGPSVSVPETDSGSLHTISRVVGANELWDAQRYGQGVGVALIDTGVVPVNGLRTPGKVRNGPDLSFDSQYDGLRHLDGYGHGTHMAGIIAGRDDGVALAASGSKQRYSGIAPGAHLVNVKVGAGDGGVDVSQVIAAIDWVVEHRNDPTLDIRVLNLSFGTDGLQPSHLDPLSHAVENAWRKGIVVVVSGGNDAAAHPRLLNPAINPYVLAVGAADLRGTVGRGDDTVASFSSRGEPGRHVDVLAPGTSVVSLRAAGSLADDENPGARVQTSDGSEARFFRGTGTSQAAAVVSGGVALLLSERPDLTPDQVKRLLVETADPVRDASAAEQGAGLIDLADAATALRRGVPSQAEAQQAHPASLGTGSLDEARGSARVYHDGVALVGEVDIFGTPWNGAAWAEATRTESAWDGGTWMGQELAGPGWGGTSFASQTWQKVSWRESSWAKVSWRDDAWTKVSWRDDGWSKVSWRDGGWSKVSWRDMGWAKVSWRDGGWSAPLG